MPRDPIKHEFMGHMLTVAQISRATGLAKSSIWRRIRNERLDRAGKANKTYQEVECNGKVYPSIAKACRDLGISNQKLYRRVHDARQAGADATKLHVDGFTIRILPRRPKYR